MIPKSLSASSITVAELCMARWNAENFERGRGVGNAAANLGTSVHGALELYVKGAYLEHKCDPELGMLLDLYKMSYADTFNTADLSGEMFDDGLEMLKNWHARTDFSKFSVLSCEQKTSFPLKTSIGDIPFNYIWDRFDQLEEGVYKVVDYKTNRWNVTVDDLTKKVQARTYGVIALMMYPNATRIWVEFDMLRYTPVGRVFSRDENIATWRFLQKVAERIIAANADDLEETLNGECRFCVRKAECGALQRNLTVGGTLGKPTAELVDLRALVEFQLNGLKNFQDELDNLLLIQAKSDDTTHLEGMTIGDADIVMKGGQRKVDASRARLAIGDELFDKYGGLTMTVGNADKLLKGTELDAEQKAQLKMLISKGDGTPGIKIKPKNPLDEGTD